MKQKNADLILLIQAGLMGFAPLLAMALLKTQNYVLYLNIQEFLLISKISLTDNYWVIALFVSIAAVSGIVNYYQSGKTKRGALLFLSSIAFLKSLAFIVLYIDGLLIHPNLSEGNEKAIVILLGYYLLWFILSLFTLTYFARKEKKLMTADIVHHEPTPGEEDLLASVDLNAETLVIAGREKRFVNYLADSFIIVLVAGPVLSVLLNIGNGGIYSHDSNPDILLQTAIGTFVYYTLYETCFHSTPGKYLSGTRVIHQAGRGAGILQTIGRSLCRLIPFDHFSFLGNRGWHDSISKTEVVEAPQIKIS